MTAAPPFAATLAESTAEQAFSFSVEGDTLLGILHAPAIVRSGTTGTGVVIVVGGPQYRGGSHRQFVQLARRLAHEGHAVLRFDVRGMGDSSGAWCCGACAMVPRQRCSTCMITLAPRCTACAC
jgi:pimeloyl-ACP methyl ester carboxylesterase